MLNPDIDAIVNYVESITEDKTCDKQLFHFLLERKAYADYQSEDFSEHYQIMPDMKNENFSPFEKTVSEYVNFVPHFTLNILGYTIEELVSDKEFQHLCSHFKMIYLFFYSDKNCILHIFA